MQRPKKESTYKDFWFIIIGSVVASEMIDSLGRDDSIFRRMLTVPFYLDLVVGFIISFLLWQLVRTVTIKLDKRYDWLTQPVERILLQLAFGILVPALLSFVFTMIFMRLVYQQDIFQTTWLHSEFYAVILIITLINLVYFTWWLFLRYSLSQKQMTDHGANAFTRDKSKSVSEEVSFPIEVSRANVKFMLKPEEISYVLLEGPYTFIRTRDEEQFVTTYALDDLHKKIGDGSFFRANRQVIIGRKSCKSYRSIENGKIHVELNYAGADPVIISQKRAKDFRKWIQYVQFSSNPDILQA